MIPSVTIAKKYNKLKSMICCSTTFKLIVHIKQIHSKVNQNYFISSFEQHCGINPLNNAMFFVNCPHKQIFRFLLFTYSFLNNTIQ